MAWVYLIGLSLALWGACGGVIAIGRRLWSLETTLRVHLIAAPVLADNDANGAGERAADEVAARWAQAGREVRVIIWDGIGDINDALKRGRRDEP